MAHQCENCKFRAHYDKKPNSLMDVSGAGTSTSAQAGKPISPLSLLTSSRHYAKSISLQNINNILKQKQYGKRVFSVYR